MSRRHLLIVLLCLAWIVPGLLGREPWKTDEPYTFGVIFDMLRGGSWLVPTLAGEPFLHEPPLYYLSAALTAYLSSPWLALHDGARIATGLYMALALVCCGLAGRELYGKGNGTVSALLLMGCFGLTLRGHEMITDIVPLAGFALAYYAWALAPRRTVLAGVWLGIAVGMVFLSQGALETLILMAIAALLPAMSRAWRTREYAATLLTAALIAAPLISAWPLALHARSPELLQLWLQNDLYAIAGTAGRDYGYYLRLLPWHAWPVWALCAFQLWHTPREHYFAPAVALPLTGFVITLIALSLGGGGRDLYALTLLPAAALLATPAIPRLPRGAANAWLYFGVTGATFFIVVAWFYWSGLEVGMPARLHAHLNRLQPGYVSGFKLLPFALAALYTVAWFTLLAKLERNAQRPVIVWAAAVTVLWGLSAHLFAGWFDTGKSYRSAFTSLKQNLPAKHRCVASRNLGDTQRAMLHYYAGVITRREETARDYKSCDLLLIQNTAASPPLADKQWRKIWEGQRPRDKIERYHLYRRNP
jgi:4-amino-4-deoxy-L-arabinose transferase-like glycosyltransferase